MLMFRRIMSLVLVLVMVAGMLPAGAIAAEVETIAAEETTGATEAAAETVTEAITEAVTEAAGETAAETTAAPETEAVQRLEETAAETEAVTEPAADETLAEEGTEFSVSQPVESDVELPDSAQLWDAYLTGLFWNSDAAVFGTNARERLTALEQKFYDYLKAEIEKIAAGQKTSAEVEISADTLSGWGMTIRFDTTGITELPDRADVANNGIFDRIDEGKIFSALLSDCPYDLYWFDKTSGFSCGSGCSIYTDYVVVTKAIFAFQVVADMQPSGYDYSAPTVDTAFATTAKSAADAARAVVSKYASCGDYDKLVAYRDTICGLTSYNFDAANSGYTLDMDPWQLVYVFDGDSSTNVVCEGYSKAFQYLVDMSTFQGEVKSYLVTGDLDGGGHMWNVVSIGGKNYLVDVTNSDAGMAGEDGGLFLAGGSGSVSAGYTFLNCRFVYHPDTVALWGEEILTLASGDYVPEDNTAYIASGTCGDNLTWTLDDQGTLTISGSGAMTDWKYYSDSPWYSYCTQIQKVVLSEGITSIGGSAFCDISSPTEVTIPEGVTSIGKHAFDDWWSLVSITIPASVTSIDYDAFYRCYDLIAISFDGDAPAIGENAFYYATATAFYPANNATWTDAVKQNYGGTIRWAERQAVNVIASGTCGDNLTWVLDDTHTLTVTGTGEMTSYGWSAYDSYIKAAVIESGVTSITSYAFEEAVNLTSVEIADTVAKIDYRAFYNCASLTEIDLPASLTSIGSNAFDGCSGLTGVTIPDSVTSVSSYAFRDCTSLKTVSVSDKTKFGGSVFYGDSVEMYIRASTGTLSQSCIDGEPGIVKVVLDDSITTVEQYAFQNMTDLVEVQLTKNLTSIPEGLFYNCQKLKTVNLHNQLMRIGGYGFYNCDSLMEVTIPNSVTTLGTNLFNDCDCLTKVTLPVSCKGVPDYAFYGCDKLESIQLPSLVTSIGSSAFGDSAITSITWPNNLQSIGSYAFNDCDSLAAITIPETVTGLGSYAFQNCDKLASVKLPSGLTVLSDHLFDACIALETVNIPAGVTEIGSYAFRNCEALKRVTLPESLKEISSYGFYGCDSLAEITLPEGLTRIYSYAFYNCGALTSVTIPESVTYLYSNCFYNCDGLKTVKLSGGLTELPSSCFYDCDGLTSVTIPDSITTLGSSCFQRCDALTEVNFGTGLTTINDSAFKECGGLTQINLPRYLTSIRANAFSVCPKLVKIVIPASVTDIDASAFSYPDRLVIYGLPGTYAETFANNNGYQFVDGTTPATSISLSETAITMNRGASKTVYATVLPEDHTETVSWKSGNTAVVTVTDKGVLKAVGVGTANIKVVAGSVSASFTVTVVEPVSSISLNYYSRSLEALETFQLTASVYPSSANNKAIIWSSSDEAVAAVDQTGLVTTLKKGTAIITAAAADGSNAKRTCTITVTNNGYSVADPTRIETPHNYPNDSTDFWVYTIPGALGLEVTFDSRTMLEDGFDYVKIYDAKGILVGSYTGAELAGTTVEVSGDTVKVQLVSDDSGNDWGFKVTQVWERRVLEGVWDDGWGGTINWCVDLDAGTLTLTGNGMASASDALPWTEYSGQVKTVEIGPDVAYIDYTVFEGMTVLEKITVDGDNAYYTCIDGVLYGISNEKEMYLVKHPGGVESYTVPENVTQIHSKAFSCCEELKNIYFTGNMPWFEDDCFLGVTAAVNYPYDDSTWDEAYLLNYGGNITWKPDCGGNHEVVTDAAVAPTCTETGLTEGKHCSVCGTVLVAQSVVPAAGHSYDNGRITQAPTCTNRGWIDYTCTVCGHAEAEEIDATGHTTEETIENEVLPTCTDDGSFDIVVSCTVCGEELSRSTNRLPATGHTAVTDKAVDPTCTQTGLTEGSHCSDCGAVLTAQKQIPATGHSPVTDAAVEPTCDKTGLTEGSHCTVCYAVLTEQQVIPAKGHNFVDSFCTVCGAPDTLEGSFDGITWVLDSNGHLTVSGSGDMDENPWIDYADRIKMLTVETGVTTVGYHAFDGCTNLTEVSLPNSITEIDSYAFQNCVGLTEFTVPRRVETIGSGAFAGCTGLTEMVIPEGVVEVGSWAFEGCTGLESVKIPSSLSVLESYLFRDCTGLKEIVVPEGVTEMWNSVFMGCTSLERALLPESLVAMSYSIFDSCTALKEVNIPSGMDVIDDYTFSGCESLKNITIPSGIAVIGRSAFWGSGLTEVTVPAAVIEIGVGAFSNCRNLVAIHVESRNKNFSADENGALYSKDKTVLLQIPGGFAGTFPVLSSVKVIGERAAAFCHGVTGISIPQGVTTIENSAFFRSSGLKEIVLPDSVEVIEKYAFEECAALTSVTVRSACLIRELAFSECYALRDIWFKGDAASFEKYAFNYVTATAHYPAGNPTWTEDVMQSYGGTITWEPQYEVEEVVSIQTDKKDLWPGDTAELTAVLDPGARDVEILWNLEMSSDADAELIVSGLKAQLVCHSVTKRTTVTVTARTAEGSNAPVAVKLTLRPEGQVEADYTMYSGKSLQLTAYDPDTGKAYKANQISWTVKTWDEAGNLVEADAFATISKTGKLTAKKVYETVRLEVSRTVIATGEEAACLVDILPAVTQAEVISDGETVNGKTVPVDFTELRRTFALNVYPEDTLASVTWTVSDAKKQQYASYTIENDTLTVANPTGKAGTVTVKAVVDGGVKKTVTFKLQFASYARTVVLMEPGTRSLRGGETLPLYAYISEPDFVSKNSIVWSVSDKNAASISGGKLKAKNVAHPTPVTVTATSKDGCASASLEFEILPKNEGALVVKAGDSFATNTTRSLNLGDTLKLQAGSIRRGEYVEETVGWTSSKSTVATVDETGLVTAVGSGTAKITALASGNRKVTVTVKVTSLVRDMILTTKDGRNIEEVNGEPVAVVASGKSISLVAAVFPGGASSKMTWEVVEGGEYVKIASSGKLTANKDLAKAAEAVVKATAADGSGTSKTLRVKVLPIAQGLQIFESGIRVRSNTTFVCDMLTTPSVKLSARVYPTNAWQEVELTSSNKKIAKIDENGNLICVKPGTVTITAKALDGSNQKTTFKFTVVKMVSGLAVKEGSDLSVVGGKSLKLAPMVEITPSDATNKKLKWSVAPNAYGVTISTSGVLKTKKVYQPVTVNVMVMAQDGSGKMLSFDVTINPV